MLRFRFGMAVLLGVLLLAGPVARPVWATEANDLCAPTADPCRVTTLVMVTPASIIDVGGRELLIDAGGTLSVGAEAMTLRAGRLTVAAQGILLGLGRASEQGGAIDVVAGEILIAGRIDVTGGSGGTVSLNGTGAVTITGTIDANRLANDGGGGEANIRGSLVTFSGAINAVGGTFGFGGDVTIESVSDLMFSGQIDVQGGDGGGVEFTAGIGVSGAGNLLLDDSAIIDADARAQGGFGGSIDLDARGDGIATGKITLDAILSANGGSGTEDTTGGDGGSISVTSVGDIVGASRGAQILVEGGRPDGFGGDAEILITLGSFSYAGQIVIGPQGEEGGGGDLTVDVSGEATLRGSVSGRGASEVLIDTDRDLTITQTGSIDLSDGGAICLDAGGADLPEPARIVIAGSVTANAGNIDIVANDGVTVTAPIRAEGPQAGGDGGDIAIVVASGPVLTNALLSVVARNPGSNAGGVLAIEGRRVRINGRLDADGTGGSAGRVGIRGDELIELAAAGVISASTTLMGAGGNVELISGADLTVLGAITANGGAATTVGGSVQLEGCIVQVERNATLTVLRVNGVNRIIGRESILVLGDVTADEATGLNEFRYRNAGDPPLVFGAVLPRQVEILDPTLTGCVANQCGNNQLEPPETCDDGNMVDGDGCSRDCQMELRGDVDGDGAVNDADLFALIAEIFDGDGDRVADVESPDGTFPGKPTADANEDERITAADTPAIVRLLGE